MESLTEQSNLSQLMRFGYIYLVRQGVIDGLDINMKDKVGNTALHHACNQGLLNMIQFLLAHNADPNATNDKGLTPLHILGQCNDARNFDDKSVMYVIQMINTLIEFGAETTRLDQTNNLPFQYFSVKKVRDYLRKLTHKSTILIAEYCFKEIAGPQMSKIPDFQSKHQVYLEFSRSSEHYRKVLLTIWGSPENINKSFEAIDKISHKVVQDSDSLKNTSYSVSLTIPKDYFCFVSGSKGKTANFLRKTYNVQLFVPKKNSPISEIKIIGRKDNVNKCITKITSIISSCLKKNNEINPLEPIDSQYLGFTYGKEKEKDEATQPAKNDEMNKIETNDFESFPLLEDALKEDSKFFKPPEDAEKVEEDPMEAFFNDSDETDNKSALSLSSL